MKKFLKLLYAVSVLFEDVNKTTDTPATTGNDLSPEMKDYYNTFLIKLVGPALVHDQLGEEYPIPEHGGSSIEFRRLAPLGKQMTPLTEGVTPAGQKLNVSKIVVDIDQYGGYVGTTDKLQLTTVDDLITAATELLADQAELTLDSVTRNVMVAGTNVSYANGKTSRHALVQDTDKITVRDIRKAVRKLKLQHAPKFGQYYVGIIHPDIEFDIMDDNEWKYPHMYQDTVNLYNGELGMVAGVRFLESTEAKVYIGKPLASDATNLAVNANVSANATTMVFKGGTVAEDALAGRKILINGNVYTVASNTASTGTATITLKSGEKFAALSANDVVYPGEVGAQGANVYATMIVGKRAYARTGISGGGLQHIVKPLGSSGTSDPLNQRATIGWKAFKAAARLVEQYMVRIESTSSFETTEEN